MVDPQKDSVDEGEDLLAAARREALEEETGLRVEGALIDLGQYQTTQR